MADKPNIVVAPFPLVAGSFAGETAESKVSQ